MPEPESIMSADQREMYRGLVLIRNNEIALRWTRTQIFFLIHSAALSYVATQLMIGTLPHAALSFGGAGLGVIWLLAVLRIGHWVRYWDSRLISLEVGQPTRVFGGDEFREVTKGVTLHLLLVILSSVSVLVWLILAVPSTLRLLGRW